jgi:AAA family ATP:ADP antiporter
MGSGESQVDLQKKLERLLSVFAEVRTGEGTTALLLMANLFLLMTANYIIKPVRESLILGGAGPEVKSYAGAASAMAFLLLIPVYGKLASRLNRIRLINGVTAFFASNLVVFYILGRLHVSFGVVFFLWVGMFNLMLVAQFWAFTNDVYTEEQGKRLFAVVGIGSSLGAIFGAGVASRLFTMVGALPMMLIAAGLLLLCMGLTNCVRRRERDLAPARHHDMPLNTDGGFHLIFKQRYLLLIAVLILLSNIVSTTGEFILGKSVSDQASIAAALAGNESIRQAYIGQFYADFYFWVNLLGAVLQMFAVSRLLQRTGVGLALLLLPMIALGGYTLLSFAPALMLIRGVKIAENGTDYSLQNTARHALFLRTSPEAKYKAKTAIDSFFWRAGDAISGLVVFVGTSLAFDLRSFAKVNVILAVTWLGVAAAIGWLRLQDSQLEPEGEVFSFGDGPIPPGKDGSAEIPLPARSKVFSPFSDRGREGRLWRAEDAHKDPGIGPFRP